MQGLTTASLEKTKSRHNGIDRRIGHPEPGRAFEDIRFFQQTAGNQAVLRLLRSGAVQAKLAVSQPDDLYEQEADRVADQVMSMPDTAVGDQRSALSRGSESIRRKPG